MLYRQIILEWGQDTESGVWGLGYSPDNGKNFYVLNTTHGRKYRAEDGNRLYPYISDQVQDKIETVVAPAKSAADSAVSAADAAVASAQVTSDAVSAIASATAEAKQGANEAMSRAESAWDVATGAKEAVTDFDPLLKSAQSDASEALTQIADTASALSDAKTVFSSDVAEAKQLANTAQTTANNAVESAGENAKALASQATALSDAKKAIDSDVASAKGLANVAQATADSAIKSASSVASDLTAVASQANANASGITKVTSDVGLLQTTVADNSGNISTIQETAKQIQQAVSDNAGNITVAKQTADSAVAVASDAKSNATVAVQTASGASVTAKNAQGDATTAITTAQSAVTQASDAKSNATIAVQTASEASVTATNAQGDASIAKQTASNASVQIKNAQGDISKLQTRAGTIEASVATNSGAIANVQVTANQLKASVSDNAGNITTAKQTADSAVAVASDASSNATVASQTASQASVTAQNASGQAASAVLTANGAMTTASNAKSDATVAVQTASGASLTATNAQSDATIAKQTASEAIVQASNADSDFAQLSIRANKIEANVANNSGAIASVQQTANGLTTTVADIKSNGGGTNLFSQSTAVAGYINTGSGALVPQDSTYKEIASDYIPVSASSDYTIQMWGTTPSGGYHWYGIGLYDSNKNFISSQYEYGIKQTSDTVEHVSKTITTTSTTAYVRVSFSKFNDYKVKFEQGVVAHDWSPAPDDLQNQFTQIKTSIDGVATIINDPKTGLNATYQTAAGNATTISDVKSDVYQLQTTANGLTSRVGNLESKTNTQETAIEQNKNAIALKADQTDVNTVKGTVAGLQSSLTVQGNQIQTKVSASDVSGMLTGYATQDYTQSLVTQKADQWNLNLTSLKTDVNAIKTTGGGVNLLRGTSDDWVTKTASGSMNVTTANDTKTSVTDYHDGDKFTYSATITNNSDTNVRLEMFCCDKNGTRLTGDSYHVLSDFVAPNTTAKKVSCTIAINWNTWFVEHTLIADDGTSTSKTVQIKGEMFEVGTVAHDWSPAPSDMATVTSVTNLSATVDGIKSTVATKADQSTVTQLSNLVQAKVSSGDFTSTTTQLKNLINQRVQVGDVISQINQEAGGNTLIQVSNGKGSLILDAANTIITGEAWIPGAAIGSLDASKLTFYGANNTYATIGASVAQYDDDNQKSTINLQYNGGIEIHSSNQQGSILTMHDNTIRLASKSWGDNSNPYQYSGFYAAPNYSLMNTYHRDGTTSGVAIDDNQIHIYGSSKDQQLGALKADVGWYSINGKTGSLTGDQISLKAGNTQAVLTDNNININNASDTNSKNYDVAIHIKGWAEMTGWFTCMGITQTSLLSTKTRIEPLDTKVALDKIVSANVNTYQFKTDVAKGKTKRHASVILDDVHDVAEYCTPEEFISEDRKGRDDGDIIGYLMGAVQELKKQLDEVKEKI